MTNLKEWMDAQWRNPGVQYAGHGVVYENAGDNAPPRTRAGTQRVYKSKEQKAYEARFGIYNKKLVPVILAQANKSDASYMVIGERKLTGPIYTWPKEADAAPVVEQAAPAPRKRVSRVKLAQAQEILSKVPQDELAGFLARFGLSMSLAASIASLDNIEMISRQFLRATL